MKQVLSEKCGPVNFFLGKFFFNKIILIQTHIDLFFIKKIHITLKNRREREIKRKEKTEGREGERDVENAVSVLPGRAGEVH